jgi:hypothetical protein
MVKGGYDLVQNEVFALFGNVSYIHFDIDQVKYSPITVGLDGQYALNERMLLNGNVDYAVSGKANLEGAGDVDTNYLTARIKYTYFLTEKLGVAVGYNWSNLTMKSDPMVDMKLTDTGYTVGLNYNF